MSALALAAFCSCGDRGPSAPSPTRSTGSSVTTTTVQVGGTVALRVVDAITGERVPGARVGVAGMPAVPASPDGVVRVDVSTRDRVALTIESDGYWRRETHVRPMETAEPPATVDLLPTDGAFDLDFFDHVFRDVGEGGTHRWKMEPEFEIWDESFDCTGFTESQACEELTARGEPAPGDFLQMMRSVIENDARKYTDGRILGSRITTRSHAEGAVVPRSAFITPGKIVLAFVTRPDGFSWAFWRWAGDGSMIGGHVHLSRQHRSARGVYSHELAHTLGFAHPLGLDRVPLNSIMRRGHGEHPTRIDLLHGRVLYSRPPNSRTPDVDPADFSLNGLRTTGGARGLGGEASAP